MKHGAVDRGIIEKVAETKIRQAIEDGKFADVQGMGRPIPDIDEPYDENWWIRKWMRRERLRGLPKELRTAVDEKRSRN